MLRLYHCGIVDSEISFKAAKDCRFHDFPIVCWGVLHSGFGGSRNRDETGCAARLARPGL